MPGRGARPLRVINLAIPSTPPGLQRGGSVLVRVNDPDGPFAGVVRLSRNVVTAGRWSVGYATPHPGMAHVG